MVDRWYDVQDEQGVWRIGQCFLQDRLGTKTIGLDGFHPNFTTLFCKHSNKILPIRTNTYGLTIPEDRNPLRQVLTHLELQNASGRLNLYLMKPNYLQLDPYLIKSTVRTQFLILVDKIMGTPFSIIRQVKMLDLQISKFFINILAFYTRVLQFSKTFMAIVDKNETAKQLYRSIYQLTVMANLIFGIHPHSTKLYDHKLNINLKSMGFIDCFVMTDSGLLMFRNFFKGISHISKPQQFQYQICVIVTNLCLDLCEKSRSHLVQGPNQSKTMLVLDQIINSLKYLLQQNQALKLKISKNQSLISRIQALYFKFRSKTCPLRKYITKQQNKEQKVQKTLSNSLEKVIKEQEVHKLQQRIKKLEAIIANQSKNQTYSKQQFKDGFNFERPHLPVQNLGEEMFLGSLQWALETGDIQTAKKLTKWRKSLLQIGRITGWQVALAIGARTYKKQEITAGDIIQANYQHLSKLHKN